MDEKARRHFERIEEELMHAVELESTERVAYQCGRLDAQRDERWWFIRLFAFVMMPSSASWKALTGKAQQRWVSSAKAAKSRALIRVVVDRQSELWSRKSTDARVELARILIESGADPLMEWDADPLVVIAASRACPSMVALLVEKGADPDQEGSGGKSARDYLEAARARYVERGLSDALDRALWARSRRVSEIEARELRAQHSLVPSEWMGNQKNAGTRVKRL